MQLPIDAEQKDQAIARGIRTAVSAGMQSPYRDEILAGIEEAGEDLAYHDEPSEEVAEEKSSRRLLQGALVVAILIAVVIAIRRVTAE